MPKMKTHSSAKKRFTITGSGKIKRFQANKSHRLRNRDKNTKLRLTGSTLVSDGDYKRVLRMLAH